MGYAQWKKQIANFERILYEKCRKPSSLSTKLSVGNRIVVSQ
jgi:hypothetical protein